MNVLYNGFSLKLTFTLFEHKLRLYIKVSFSLRNRPLEWNDYSYEIFILLFGRGLFLGICIPIGIPIPLKNERNSYSLG
jgi:hypothetical protein